MARQQGSRGFRPTVVSLAVASCFVSSAALANPTGPQVVHGAANITNPAANILNIATTTPQTIINWGSFSISVGELTRFMQPSAASAVLNRIAAGNPSQILGALQSNGRVFLINPSGITFGAGSQVDVAGLVATSLNLSNQDFLAGKLKFSDVPGAGSIVNQGNITTGSGGQVFLVGPAVTNSGIIASPKGDVVLAAGNSVELVNPGTPNLRVEITAPDNQAVNLGQIVAESGRVGIYAGLINNSGTIRADSAVAEGGRIMLKATKSVTLESTSILDASGNGGGRIEVLAQDSVKVAGKLDASAPVSGDGGFIETSAHTVKVASGTVVRAGAANGKKGTWLIDPDDIVISAYGGDVAPATIVSALNAGPSGTDVTIATNPAAYGGSGDITVSDAVSWNSAGSLSLIAMNNLMVDAPISNTGTGGLSLYAGWDGAGNPQTTGFTPTIQPGIGWIWLPSPILMNQASGKVVLVAGNEITQHGGTGEEIVANELLALSLGSRVILNDSGNSVNVLAGGATAQFEFQNSRTLAVGTVASTSGITVTPGSGVIPNHVSINVSSAAAPADLNVNSNISVTAPASYGGRISLSVDGSNGGNINVSGAALTATGGSNASDGGKILISNNELTGGNVTIDNSTLTATGGVDASYGGDILLSSVNGGGISVSNSALTASSNGATLFSGRQSNVQMTADTIGVLNSTVQATGGTNTTAGSGGGYGMVDINASNGTSITGSVLRAQGGSAGGPAGGGIVDLNSGNGTLNVTGGSLVEALGGTSGLSYTGGEARILLSSNSVATINVTGSTVRAIGGAGTDGGSGEGYISISDNSSNINITNSTIRADGAEGSIHISTPLALTISGSTLSANSVNGTDEPVATIGLSGSTVNISGSTLSANNANGTVGFIPTIGIQGGTVNISSSTISASGGDVSIEVYATGIGGTNISGSTITATAQGFAEIDIESGTSGGNVMIDSSTLQAAGLGAAVFLESSAGVTATNSTISATGQTGTSGSSGMVSIFADNGAVNTSGSTITAAGRTAADGGEGSAVVIEATGDVTLGLLASNDFVAVTSNGGRILDGNAGANVSAPSAFLLAANGVGSLADPLETQTTNLIVSTTGGEIGVINDGNLVLTVLQNSGTGANAVGTTGTMVLAAPISVSGNLALLSNNGMVVEQNISSGGDLILDGGIGDLGFTGVSVFGNNVNLSGNNVLVGFTTSTAPTTVMASNLMTVKTAGNLNVLGGANSAANAVLGGGVDVDLTVGTTSGFVNVVGGSFGASAQISAGSTETITLSFPTLTSGGFFVNGIEGAISDGNTGFFANGKPAVLGDSFKVTYGGVTPDILPPSVQTAIDQVVAVTNQQTTMTQNTNSNSSTESDGDLKDDKQKKQLPICGK